MSKIKSVLEFMNQTATDRIDEWKARHNALKELSNDLYERFLDNVRRDSTAKYASDYINNVKTRDNDPSIIIDNYEE